MFPGGAILSPEISKQDATTSALSIERLCSYIKGSDRSLVFFVGAGASYAGYTGLPSTPSLLYHLLLGALAGSGRFDLQHSALPTLLEKISSVLGFEITLNDFWQIRRHATSLIYSAFASAENKCNSNRVHKFMAYWLSTGGTVITTNYDRLIEREWAGRGKDIQSRYQEIGFNSFADWQDDLSQGGCLFKTHGSLDDPDSCLGALEHVGTQLSGKRAELLSQVLRTRPLCFVGWQGIDPDIPPLLYEEWSNRDSSLPTFWIHYEGKDPNSTSLQKQFDAIEQRSSLISPYIENQPILTEADRAFGQMLEWVGISSSANPQREPVSFDFSEAIKACSPSGVTRMVGISLRRAGEFESAMKVLEETLNLSATAGERSAALQEISLLQQQIAGKKTDRSRTNLEKARNVLSEKPDPWLQANIDFGLLLMSVVSLQSRPWLLLKLSTLFRRYKQDINLLQDQTSDKESVALHKSLLQLYLGRLRFKLFGWIARVVNPIARWIIEPFNTARSTIDDAIDIHLHSRVDVLPYRAVAFAYLHRCQEAREDLEEVERLVQILKDNARMKHWQAQRSTIEKYCARS